MTRRARVTRLADRDFAEYVRLTVPYAAASEKDVPAAAPGRVGRLLQRGFLFVVAATRLKLDHPAMSRLTLRLKTFWLLAHLHGLAPRVDRVDIAALRRPLPDINGPDIQPVAYHYLRATLESLGASERPVLEDVAVAVSYLNAARSLAAMNGREVPGARAGGMAAAPTDEATAVPMPRVPVARLGRSQLGPPATNRRARREAPPAGRRPQTARRAAGGPAPIAIDRASSTVPKMGVRGHQ